MKIISRDETLEHLDAEATLVFILKQNFEHKWVDSGIDFKSMGFKAEAQQTFFDTHKKVLYYAIDTWNIDILRESCAKALKIMKSYTFSSFKCGIIDCKKEKNTESAIRAMIMGFLLGNYCFNSYKTKKDENKLEKIVFSLQTYHDKHVEEALFESINKEVNIISASVNFTRDLVNTIPQEATPIFLAQKAEKLAKELKLECKIEDENFLKEQMGAFYAVSRASVHPPRFIHLAYKPQKPQKTIAIVGKGLTYDSGGLSLKPADYMVTMKADKSGGCAAMGIIKAIAQMKLNVEIHSIIGATENMIGGDSFKPDDVLRAKNGKTIEVRNTDAEGRLVLCDCLCYAQDLKPDYIIDLATLTGACVVALGEYTTGVLGFDEKLKKRFLKSARHSGELAVSLPFNRHLRKLIDSKVADICNISSTRYGGALTAGLFLGEFIQEEYKNKWLHLDIAGPAYVEKEWDVNPFGASGAGVRMVIEFIKNLIKES